jgi:AbrB family looped-hinge helix DNA binding protein
MSKKISDGTCCASDEQNCGCRVESIVSIDERGQMVLPKELRDRVGIRGGENFAVVSWEREGELCCISLIQVKDLSGMVNELLAPMLKEVTAK